MRRRAFLYVDRYQRYGNVFLLGYLMILSVPEAVSSNDGEIGE